MTVAVLGNGESRAKLDLNSLKQNHIVIGCNAIHRDFLVDHLVCCDRRMAVEASEGTNFKNLMLYVRERHYHYFRKVKKNKNVRPVPNIPFTSTQPHYLHTNWGSGSYAVLLATELASSTIDLFGFDLYSSTEFVNNLYKDTQHYSSSTSPAVDPNYTILQLAEIFRYYPQINFRIFNKIDWKLPEQWQKKNVELLTYKY